MLPAIATKVKCHIVTFLEESPSCQLPDGTACALQGGKEAQSPGSMPVAEQLDRTGQAK